MHDRNMTGYCNFKNCEVSQQFLSCCSEPKEGSVRLDVGTLREMRLTATVADAFYVLVIAPHN